MSERGLFIDTMCQIVSEQETGGRQMLRIMYQSTASKIALQMRILMRGSVLWVKEQPNHAKSIASFLFVCVCKCMRVCLCVCVVVSR